jgi:hypothetical protein
MELNPVMLIEACYPLGDSFHTRDVKRAAVRAVVFDRRSYRDAARVCRLPDTAGYKSVQRWVDEFEERLRLAKESADGQGAQAETWR